MSDPAALAVSLPDTSSSPLEPAAHEASRQPIPSGIAPLDHRIGGLEPGGAYLLVGAPGPAKMVAALQFLRAGIQSGEPCLLLTNADASAILGVARAWGLDLQPAWRDGTLRILGFRDEFELRAVRSVEPEEVVEELDALAGPHLSRISVDPGSLFLAAGARSLLGSSFLKWARQHPATVCATLSVDGGAAALPSSADWLLHATTGCIEIARRSQELYDLALLRAAPGPQDEQGAVSVQLKPSQGLVAPDAFPARRGRDRPGVDPNRVLLVSLGSEHAADVEAWARASFATEVVDEPFEAVAVAQEDPSFGGIVVLAPRTRVREAVQACRALRPLARAAILFVSDDAVRSTDRIHILEAGADDCLSGGVDFRELDLRLRQAIAAGSKPVPERPQPSASGSSRTKEGGLVELAGLQGALQRRAADPVQKFFCLLEVRAPSLGTEHLGKLLAQQVRSDAGDLVSTKDGGCLVLLQGAREAQLSAFLGRLHERLREAAGEGAADAEVRVHSHPADSERIRALVGASGERPD